jgi:hypothetical protein
MAGDDGASFRFRSRQQEAAEVVDDEGEMYGNTI